MIGRRGFLQCIGAAVLGMSLALKAPERLSTAGVRVRAWNAVASRFETIPWSVPQLSKIHPDIIKDVAATGSSWWIPDVCGGVTVESIPENWEAC
jgi:hypothetical protein